MTARTDEEAVPERPSTQMTRERRADNADWPEWLHMAWFRDGGKAREEIAFRVLIASLVDPEQGWEQETFDLTNRAAGLCVHTYTAWPFMNTRPERLTLSLWQKWQLRKAVNIARSNAVTRRLVASRAAEPSQAVSGPAS